MSKGGSLKPFVGALVVFALYFLGLLIWSQEGVYERPTSLITSIGLTVGEVIYGLVLVAEFRLAKSNACRVGVALMSIALLLLITLNWIDGRVSSVVAIAVASCAALLIVIGATIWWLDSRRQPFG